MVGSILNGISLKREQSERIERVNKRTPGTILVPGVASIDKRRK